MSFFAHIEFWHWWIAAVVLVIVEVFAPGAFFIWLGAAAAVTGLVLLVLPETPWQAQFLIWSLLSAITVAGWRFYLNIQHHTIIFVL